MGHITAMSPHFLADGEQKERMNRWELGSERWESAQDTLRPSSQHKRDAFATEGQRAGNKKQKDRRQEMREKGKEIWGGEKEYLPQRDNGLPLDREGIGMIQRKMAAYRGKGETQVRMSCFILTGHVNYGSQKGTCDFGYFDSWT